jgi:alpha-amylase
MPVHPTNGRFGRTLAHLTVLGLGLAAASAHAVLNPKDTSVQMFEWSWNDIATECTQWLGPKGFGAVQISPPHASKNANGWWGVYQPVNYVNLTSRMGTPAQLQAMINTCHAAGVRIYADIVVNQMADGSGTATDGSSWNAATLSYPFFSASDFHGNCSIQPGDYNSPAGRANVQNCRLGGLPDLATESSYVQGQIANYMKALLALGVDGFRIDAAKHMPAGALSSILTQVKATYPNTLAGEPIWVTQEIINDGEVDRGSYLPVGTINEFQFTSAMKEIFRGNNGLSLASIPSVMGTWGNWGGTWGFLQPQNATIFITNWDTERNGGSLNSNNFISGAANDTANHRYELASLFMLAQGYGEAQLYSGYKFNSDGEDRPAVSPYSGGVPQINVKWDFVHRWPAIANMVAWRNAVSGQVQQNWLVGDNANQVAFNRGSVGFAAFNNSGAAWNRSFATGLAAGTYCDVITGGKNAAGTACTGTTVTVGATGTASIVVPASTGAAVPAVALYTGQKLAGGAGSCAVSFTIANANTSFGQNLRVVGNVAALGAWVPGSGFALTIQGSGANVPWTGTVSLPAGTAVQYKYVKWNGSTAVWESNQATASGNREMVSCASGGSQVRNDGNFKF